MRFRFVFNIIFLLLPLVACNSQPPSTALYQLEYPFLNESDNAIQFYSRTALKQFQTAWKNADKEKLVIVELGDSHLQADILPGQLRRLVQAVHGDGGRGTMRAFSTVRTYSSIDYTCNHTGIWEGERAIVQRPKLPLGVCGMSCRTTEPGASLIFDFKKTEPETNNRLRIFCKQSAQSFDIIVSTPNGEVPVSIDQSDASSIVVALPAIVNNITIRTVQNSPTETEFEFYGMSLESTTPNGAVVHNAGVGAARYQSILKEELFVKQLPDLDPDLVIVDFGTNDYLYDDIIQPELEDEVRKVVANIRSASPQASILLTSAQDMSWKGRNRNSGQAFSELIHRVASDMDCAVFDWYWVSGAKGTIKDWLNAGLAQKDQIHLTMTGYQLKGNLMFGAIMRTLKFLDENPDATSLVYDITDLKAIEAERKSKTVIYDPREKSVASSKSSKTKSKKDSTSAKSSKAALPGKPSKTSSKGTTTDKSTTAKTTTAKKTTSTKGKKSSYTVKSGDTLGGIAVKKGVTVKQIKAWNGLKSDKLKVGKVLVIYK